MDSRPSTLFSQRSPACPGSVKNKGFTLVELLVTLTIVSILTMLAAPSFSRLIADQRIKATASDLYMSLMRARSEALKRNTTVTVSPKSASDWSAGWYIADPSSSTLKVDDHNAISGIVITGAPTSVSFRSSGRVLATTAPAFTISSSSTPKSQCVSVDLGGRPYSKAGSC